MKIEYLYLSLAVEFGFISDREALKIEVSVESDPGSSILQALEARLSTNNLAVLVAAATKRSDHPELDPDATRVGRKGIQTGSDREESVKPVRTSGLDWCRINDRVSEEQDQRYTFKGEQGRGAIGRVLIVYDENIGRDIAIKELLSAAEGPPTSWDGRESSGGYPSATIDRFLREARIAGQLQHPSIIPVYDIGRRSSGDYYYSMKLVRGKTLLQAIKNTEGLEGRLKLLSHFSNLCHAIAYAHSRNVIHRDIKPSNVMIGEFGETVVLDWGLAKVAGEVDEKYVDLEKGVKLLLDSRTGKTQMGSALGTPSYMSPEQALGSIDEIDQQSDVYALGAVLYHILSGHTLYDGETAFEIIQKVKTKPIKPLSAEPNPPPRELAAIAEKALSRKKKDRYNSTAELVEEIEAYMSGEKVGVYEYTSLELFQRFAQKNRTVVAAALTILLVLVVAFVVSFSAYQVANRAFIEADSALDRENAAKRESHYHMSQALIKESEKLLQNNQLLEGGIYAAASLLHNPAHESSPFYSPEFTIRNPQTIQFKSLALSNLYQIDNRMSLKLLDVLTTSEPREIAFAPNGELVAISGADNRIRLWKIGTRETPAILEGHDGGVYSVSFSPDGKWVASGSDDYSVRIWDIETGAQIARLDDHTGRVYSVRFSPDGQTLASAGADKRIILWSVETLSAKTTLRGHEDMVATLAFSPDGKFIASGSADNRALLWDLATGTVIKTLSMDAVVWTIDFSHDGKRLVTGSYDRTVRVWDVGTGVLLHKMVGHKGDVNSVVFAPDGQTICSAGMDGKVVFWDAETYKQLYSLQTHPEFLWNIAFSPDGKRLISGSFDKTVKLWSVDYNNAIKTLEDHQDVVFAMRFMPDGKKIISSSFDKSIKIWDMATGRLERTLRHDDLAVGLSISPDNRKIASAGYDRVVRVWDAATGAELLVLKGHTKSVLSATFSPDGKWIASGSQDHSLKLWDAATGEQVLSLDGHSGAVWDLKFSPDGTRIASGGRDNTARIWDAKTGQQIVSLPHDDWVSSVAFSGQGKRLFTGTKKGEISVWDLQTAQKVMVFGDNIKWVYGLEISPDGKYLGSCSGDQSVRLWRIDTREPLLTISTPHCYRVDFSADGRKLAFGHGKNVRVLPLDLSTLDRAPSKVLSNMEQRAGLKLEGFLLKHLSADAFHSNLRDAALPK